jgi:hypothetical protein
MLTSVTLAGPPWIAFLVLVPMGLGLLVWWRLWWAGMACVMYGTVGLAIDLSTLVHMVGEEVHGLWPLLNSLVSGTLNCLLIPVGGRSFLGMALGQRPPGSPPPNPVSPS